MITFNEVRHFVWWFNGATGRVAVQSDGSRLVVKPLAESDAPPAELLFALLKKLGNEFIERCNLANYEREHRFTTHSEEDGGSIIFTMVEELDYALRDYLVTDVIFVSVTDTLYSGIDIAIENVIPLSHELSRWFYKNHEKVEMVEIEAPLYETRLGELELEEVDGRLAFAANSRLRETWEKDRSLTR